MLAEMNHQILGLMIDNSQYKLKMADFSLGVRQRQLLSC